MRKGNLIVIVVCMMIAATVSAQTIIPGGNVSGTWTAVGSPYLIQGEITVPAGETLNIQPGVEVNFQGHYKLIINGWLEAIGTETDSILLSVADTVSGWHSIRFINAPDTSHLTYCTIQYAIAEGNSPDDYGGGIYCQNSNPMINHCTIRRNSASDGGGISVDDDSEPVISYCLFSENFATKSGGGLSCIGDLSQISYCTFSQNQSGYFGGGIFCGWTELTISHCTISGNSAIFGAGIFNYYWSNTRTVDCTIIDNIAIEQGGGIFASDCDPMVENCSIMRNSAHFGGGIAISSNANNTEINNCHISDNQALRGGGLYIYDSDPTINKCTINGNTAYNTSHGQGGGIYLEYSESQIRYCTIYGNTAQVEGAGIYCATSNPIILNTIVAESNQNGGIYFADIQNATISYCDFYSNEGGNFTGYYPGGLGQIDTVNYNGNWCDMYFNIFEDPLFADPINNNFQITWQNFPVHDSTKSPCIDAGDPASPPDPDSTIADIGALYFDQGTVQQVFITLTPYGLPIYIPATGGSFDYNIAAANNGDSTVTTDIWCMVTLPNGNPYGPVLGPINITMPQGFSANRDRMQYVPIRAPEGSYMYRAYIGTYPNVIIDQDSFPFMKICDYRGQVIYNWQNNGEEFGKK